MNGVDGSGVGVKGWSLDARLHSTQAKGSTHGMIEDTGHLLL
ncbi:MULTISPECIES: hypothetical protein [Corallococcus]|nr:MULTISPECIES: hypothetical protein [Corallococcus]